jgi:transposase-like protein
MGEMRMSSKERKRLGIMARIDAGEIRLKDASNILGISYRQIKRIRVRYRQHGDAGLVHRNRGRPSNHKYSDEIKDLVKKLYVESYNDFGPVLFSEKLLENHDMKIDHETLRRWLISEGLWQKKRKPLRHRSRRQRREHFGELIQMDGSFHNWFGEEKACLMVMVDDATGRTMAFMSDEETTEAAMRLLWSWIERHGVPVALYTDREPTLEEELSGKQPLTAFGSACNKLGISIIPAYSPQAKGRVERKNGVFQDRLVKELRLLGIKTIEETNQMLDSFTDKLNEKFAIEPASLVDYHTLPEGIRLEDVFSFEDTRTINNDWTIRYESRLYQLKAQSNLPPAQNKVRVRKRLDGSMQILYRDIPLDYKEISSRPVVVKAEVIKPKTNWKPSPDHPWRSYRKNIQDEIVQSAAAARGTVPLALTP